MPLRIRKTKAGIALRLEYDFARAPTELLAVAAGASSSSNGIPYSLQIASYKVKEAANQMSLHLGKLNFEDSVRKTYLQEVDAASRSSPAEWDVTRYSQRPELHWTFKKQEAGPPLALGLLASLGIVGAPLLVLGVGVSGFKAVCI